MHSDFLDSLCVPRLPPSPIIYLSADASVPRLAGFSLIT
jgi:hypothetical protein